MLKPFSTDSNLNPEGWMGENWNGLGYDVYAYFPTFPHGLGKGSGDFEVDYQDTWNDFWTITEELHPIAIMSYGNGNGPWEIEYNARNLGSWYSDYAYPRQPTPSPPDGSVPQGHVRNSTLPVQEIAYAINAADLPSIGDSGAWVDWTGNPGGFLCEYMAYLGMWYQDMHSEADDPWQAFAAGFTHLSGSVSVQDATLANYIALTETIDYLDTVAPVPLPPGLILMASGLSGIIAVRRYGLRLRQKGVCRRTE
jgi:hypothetical protein